MACLSWKSDHSESFIVAANPIFIISDLKVLPLSSIEFEILARDAELLVEHVGAPREFYISDDMGVFIAKLAPFSSATSTHPGLALLQDKPTLRGRLDFIKTVPS